MKFTEFGLDENILEAISYMGFEDATPIQEVAIPEIMKGRDLLATAQTGTGKTAAFLLPILNKLAKASEHKYINTLVIAPTRELAIQIDRQVQGFAYFINVNSCAVYGGGDSADWSVQRKALTGNTDIIVATPGKLISHLQMGYVRFDHVEHLILDEADRMLDMGFYEDIQQIVSYLPKKRQNLLFSATMPPKIRDLAKETLVDPAEVSIAISKPAAGITQLAYLVYENKKANLVKHIVKENPDATSILIFTSTKKKVFDVVHTLKGAGFTITGISSDLEQSEREEVLSQFRSGKIRVLIATDVISRGIDIKDINMVINYDVPNDAEDYVHRIGRTARADTKGIGITLICENDMYKFLQIERLIEREIDKAELPDELKPGPAWDPKPVRGGGRSGFGGKGGGGRGGNRGGNRGGGGGNRRGGGPRGEKRSGGGGEGGGGGRPNRNKRRGGRNRGGGGNSPGGAN